MRVSAPPLPTDEPLRRWASDVLGLAGASSPVDARGAVLTLVERERFVPTARQHRAAEAWMLPPGPSDDTARHVAAAAATTQLEDEVRLRDEIEEFASRFFELDREERRFLWAALRQRARLFPWLEARLAALEPGLSIDPRGWPRENPVAALALHVLELFVLSPPARARRRRQILLPMHGSAETWVAAATQLEATHAALAALEPEFIRQVRWLKRQMRAAMQKRPVQRIVSPEPVGGGEPAKESPFAFLKNGWVIYGILVVGWSILRIFWGESPISRNADKTPVPPHIRRTLEKFPALDATLPPELPSVTPLPPIVESPLSEPRADDNPTAFRPEAEGMPPRRLNDARRRANEEQLQRHREDFERRMREAEQRRREAQPGSSRAP